MEGYKCSFRPLKSDLLIKIQGCLLQGKPDAEVGVRIGVETLSALPGFRGKGWRALAGQGGEDCQYKEKGYGSNNW